MFRTTRMFRSIRWTMQMWHAAILATVLVAFGWVVFRLLVVTTYQQIDAELMREAERVSLALHPPRFRDRDGLRPEGNRPDSQQPDPARKQTEPARKQTAPAGAQNTAVRAPTDGARPQTEPVRLPAESAKKEPLLGEVAAGEPAAGEMAKGAIAVGSDPRENRPSLRRGPSARRTDRRALELSDDLLRLFDEETESPVYFVVWRTEGHLVIWHGQGLSIVKSKFAPTDIPLPDTRLTRGTLPLGVIRQRGEFREYLHKARSPRFDLNIMVGRSIRHDLASLHEKGWMMAAAGLGVLAAGLLGGHFFSQRSLQPIEAMSATAAEISLSNLSRRIDISGTETELSSLARTLNKMFDRLESSFNQQVRFTADASHELRTPLAVILSHTELALGKHRSAEELRETIETCRRSGLRMKSLVESLLTLARFDSGELQIEERSFDISRTAADCVALVRPLAEQRKISLQLDLIPTSVLADPDRIAQVITNLLTNAIRYNHDHGEVVLAVRSTDRDVILSVADTGIGIPSEHLPYIFERFYRVDTARSRKDGAIGLGLAICKSIVVAHGGEIFVTSNAGRGTVFEVQLPRHGSEGIEGPAPESRRSDSLTASGCA